MKSVYSRNVFINCPFKAELPRLCEGLKLSADEMIFNDYTNLVSIWLKENPHFPDDALS